MQARQNQHRPTRRKNNASQTRPLYKNCLLLVWTRSLKFSNILLFFFHFLVERVELIVSLSPPTPLSSISVKMVGIGTGLKKPKPIMRFYLSPSVVPSYQAYHQSMTWIKRNKNLHASCIHLYILIYTDNTHPHFCACVCIQRFYFHTHKDIIQPTHLCQYEHTHSCTHKLLAFFKFCQGILIVKLFTFVIQLLFLFCFCFFFSWAGFSY